MMLVVPKLGRSRPHPARVEAQLPLRLYRTGFTPVPAPDGLDWGALCIPALHMILGNGPDDTAPAVIAKEGVGNCTCAAPCHLTDIWTAGSDAPIIITTDQAVTLYELACNYVLGNAATDLGGNELSVLDYIAAHGIDGKGLYAIDASASVDAADVPEMKDAIVLTGGVELCLELPNPYITPFPAADDVVWDLAGAPNPENGHCVLAKGFTSNCPNGKPAYGIDSWGKLIWYTTDACAEYSVPSAGGSANVALSKTWVSKKNSLAPNGLNLAQLTADFQSLTTMLKAKNIIRNSPRRLS